MAAGAASRFGDCKALQPLGDNSLLGSAIARLSQAGIEDIRIISGAWHEKMLQAPIQGATLHYCQDWQRGLGHSIAFGVEQVDQADGILILLADQVAVTSEDILRLQQAFDGQHSVCAHYANRKGVPAIFAPRHWPALMALEGDRGARQLLQQHDAIVAIDMPNAAIDIDTKEQLEGFRAQTLRGDTHG